MKLLIYSHDTFGLGHLRRCRTIAHSLLDHRHDLSVLILSGSPIIGSYGFRARVDFIRIPGVVKLRSGGYTPRGLDISTQDAIAIREAIIRSTADVFKPDIFLVDKEPLGLRGEVLNTLELLKTRGTRNVLGLRDVMDDPSSLAEEWERKTVLPALEDLYDDIWVYGRPEIYNPLEGIDVSQKVLDKVTYTGYLRRSYCPTVAPSEMDHVNIEQPFILVTPGGGGDGAALVDWTLRAYEHDPDIPASAVIVFGPFMHADLQAQFRQRVNRLAKVHALTFDANIEHLMSLASGIVAMGGYNTFCEILSFDKPGIIVPRTTPRLEQYIRASRAQDLGLTQMLVDDGHYNPQDMARALRQLPDCPRPSQANLAGLLDGVTTICGMVDQWADIKKTGDPGLKIVGGDISPV
jgi:predicted glycosyltransferase